MDASEFKALFTQFASETDERVESFIDLAAPYFDVSRWGDFYSEGIANWVAHSIVVSNAEAAASTSVVDADDFISDSAGGASTTRSGQMIADEARDPFLRTSYGRRYCYLRRLVGMGGVVVH